MGEKKHDPCPSCGDVGTFIGSPVRASMESKDAKADMEIPDGKSLWLPLKPIVDWNERKKNLIAQIKWQQATNLETAPEGRHNWWYVGRTDKFDTGFEQDEGWAEFQQEFTKNDNFRFIKGPLNKIRISWDHHDPATRKTADELRAPGTVALDYRPTESIGLN